MYANVFAGPALVGFCPECAVRFVNLAILMTGRVPVLIAWNSPDGALTLTLPPSAAPAPLPERSGAE